jgi:hypothetical protein
MQVANGRPYPSQNQSSLQHPNAQWLNYNSSRGSTDHIIQPAPRPYVTAIHSIIIYYEPCKLLLTEYYAARS